MERHIIAFDCIVTCFFEALFIISLVIVSFQLLLINYLSIYNPTIL